MGVGRGGRQKEEPPGGGGGRRRRGQRVRRCPGAAGVAAFRPFRAPRARLEASTDDATYAREAWASESRNVEEDVREIPVRPPLRPASTQEEGALARPHRTRTGGGRMNARRPIGEVRLDAEVRSWGRLSSAFPRNASPSRARAGPVENPTREEERGDAERPGHRAVPRRDQPRDLRLPSRVKGPAPLAP
eukprot:gene17449-biopygen10677